MVMSIEDFYNKMKLDDERKRRILSEANWYIDNNSNVREVASNFMVSKSQVYVDFTKHLKHLDYELYIQVLNLLKYNKSMRVKRMNEINHLKRHNKR